MPILEPTELFLRKSGGQLASQMYSFTDAGGNSVSLRPEFTAPIMRHYLEHASEIDLPASWQYAGPVFRYEPPESGPSGRPQDRGQFTQVGAELIGSDSVLADAELLSLASQVPAQLGLSDCWLELADLAVIHSLLDVVGLSERARSFVIANIPALREGEAGLSRVLERARQIHLSGPGPDDDELNSAIAGLDDRQAREVLQGFLQWHGGATPAVAPVSRRSTSSGVTHENNSAEVDGDSRQSAGPSGVEKGSGDIPTLREEWGDFGQRRPEEIVDRLLRKLRGSDDWGKLTHGLDLIAELVAIKGEPTAALDSAQGVLQRAGATSAALDRLAQVVELLSEPSGSESARTVGLKLDFGLARGLAYYNGIIFEVKHPDWPDSLGGGGRYDGLARALGSGADVPACGFAYTLEALLSLGTAPVSAEFSGQELRQELPSTLVVSEEPGGHQEAMDCAGELRKEGYSAELDVCGMALAQALTYARGRGIGQVVAVQPGGQRATYQVD
jgi:histidyl-tRNA synthetase